MRWAGENDFNDLIISTAQTYSLDPDLVKGLIGQESQFKPDNVGDDGTSFGLMQINTGAGAPGAGMTQAELSDPQTNIDLGCRYLAEQIAVAGSIDGGISAYNGGYRPWLGFGKPLATGSFNNQTYVDHVKANWAYFQSLHPASAGPAPGTDQTGGTPTGIIALIGLAVAGIATLIWLAVR